MRRLFLSSNMMHVSVLFLPEVEGRIIYVCDECTSMKYVEGKGEEVGREGKIPSLSTVTLLYPLTSLCYPPISLPYRPMSLP